jgi:hypothetical protein
MIIKTVKMFKNLYIAFICLLSFSFVQAQTDTTKLEDETIDIVKDYEPVVIRANKKSFAPKIPEITIDKPTNQTYSLPITYQTVAYKPTEIKPLSYPKEEAVSLPFIYLKAGFGNYLTPLIDFQVTNKISDKYRVAFELQHMSSRRNKIENQSYGETDFDLTGEYYFRGMTAGASPYFTLDNYHFYGYDQSDTSFTKDETRNRYNKGGLDLYFFNHQDNAIELDYRTDLGFHTTSDSYGNKEISVNWDNHVTKKFKEIFTVGGQTMMNITSIKSLTNQNRFAVGFNPYVEVGKEKWQVRGGLWVIIDEGNVYALPDIRHQSKLYKDYIVIYNEWIGHLEINSLRALSEQNPWLAQSIPYNNFRIETRNFLGVKGNIPVGLDYDARFSQIVYYDAPLFVNDTTIFNKFNVSYDSKLRAWNGHVSVGYQLADFLKIRTGFDYFSYNPNDAKNMKAWHLPNFKVNASAVYQYKNKLIIEADLFAFSGVNALDGDGTVKKLKGNVDLNFSASYHLNKNIAFFAQVNNALSLKNERWYKYPGYGFLALGGVIVSF